MAPEGPHGRHNRQLFDSLSSASVSHNLELGIVVAVVMRAKRNVVKNLNVNSSR